MVRPMASSELPDGRMIRVPDVEGAAPGGTLGADVDLDGVLLEDAEYQGLVAEGTVARSILRGVDLSESKLDPVTFTDVLLRNVDLSNASLQQVVARRVEVSDCRAIGV